LEVWASDFHAEPPQRLKKSKVHYIDVSEVYKAEKQYDFIILKHVLEHTHDPVIFLKNMKKLLREKGRLMIEVPNLKEGSRRLFGKYAQSYSVPDHIIHFTDTAFKRTIQKAGFDPLVFWQGNYPPFINGSLSYLLNIELNNYMRLLGAMFYIPLQWFPNMLTGERSTLKALITPASNV
jgi:SAM-dependent methyltransferase